MSFFCNFNDIKLFYKFFYKISNSYKNAFDIKLLEKAFLYLIEIIFK